MLNIVLCDDTVEIMDQLEIMVEDILKGQCRISKFNTGYGAEIHIHDVVNGNIDILFIDIDLGEQNGVSVAKAVKERYPDIKIIFITSYAEYSQDVFEVETTYLLLKPIKRDKLHHALEKAINKINTDRHDAILFSYKGVSEKVRLKDILFVESNKRKIIVYEAERQIKAYEKLDEIHEELPVNFVRCHQSYIVNLDYVRHLNEGCFLLYGGMEVPVSKGRYNASKKELIRYIGDSL